ncbi:esterase/lipase family protein [Cellulomonas sp. NPDC057328]|uniref:esterase/lipase family protein n=1 Tax=Cellulomonas sp. NPDC057328 TaxID=3346101 RepID=UPI003642AC58
MRSARPGAGEVPVQDPVAQDELRRTDGAPRTAVGADVPPQEQEAGVRVGWRRRVQQAVAWGRDYAWIAAAQVAATVRQPPADDLATGTRTPVLLLPGIYETWPVMDGVVRYLHDEGHPVHAVPALGYNGRTLEESAQRVVDRLTELDLDEVVLVAHSKGGLIGKLVLGTPGVGDRVAGMVAVNTPFSGSVYARWFPVRAVRALSPQDPHVLALARQVAANGRIWSVFARFDPHVPGGSELPGAVNVRVPVDGHFRALGDARVHAAVLDGVGRLAAAWRERRGVPASAAAVDAVRAAHGVPGAGDVAGSGMVATAVEVVEAAAAAPTPPAGPVADRVTEPATVPDAERPADADVDGPRDRGV